jgi:hypothetical protein
MPKERPILFSAPMVRALLAGSKTQTRRAMKTQPAGNTMCVTPWMIAGEQEEDDAGRALFLAVDSEGDSYQYACPYGKVGDLLWVRESYTLGTIPVALKGADYLKRGDETGDVDWCLAAWYEGDPHPGGWFAPLGKKPSIHMPRWASRLTLRITDVRVEQLQSISARDAVAEGVGSWRDGWDRKTSAEMFLSVGAGMHGDINKQGVARTLYRALWESINGSGSWEANPWVWVVEFEKVEVTP